MRRARILCFLLGHCWHAYTYVGKRVRCRPISIPGHETATCLRCGLTELLR